MQVAAPNETGVRELSERDFLETAVAGWPHSLEEAAGPLPRTSASCCLSAGLFEHGAHVAGKAAAHGGRCSFTGFATRQPGARDSEDGECEKAGQCQARRANE